MNEKKPKKPKAIEIEPAPPVGPEHFVKSTPPVVVQCACCGNPKSGVCVVCGN